ncbi:MAG: biopolymer transporter ExbD [bacterium]|nr:biopolymer transporter ExbD [bacterium]
MRLKKKDTGIVEGDLTPMIDMTFQLIAFFMVLINFAQSEEHQRVKLPSSELAKPPRDVIDDAIILHVTENGKVAKAGMKKNEVVPIDGLSPYLKSEIAGLQYAGKNAGDATIIIRAHRNTPAKFVQQLIKVCQENQFEQFALRAKEKVPGAS